MYSGGILVTRSRNYKIITINNMALGNIEKKNYVSILGSDATIRQVVPEGTEGSIVREYETSDGSKGSKIEKVYQFIEGTIENVAFHASDYGTLLQITLDGLILSVDTNSPFGEDIMKKLPSVDLSKPVRFTPFNFVTEKGKTKKGVTVTQGDKKIQNFFYDEETKKKLNGYPEPAGDEKNDKDLWKIYFIKCRKFLENYTKEKFCKDVPVVSQADKDFDDIKFD